MICDTQNMVAGERNMTSLASNLRINAATYRIIQSIRRQAKKTTKPTEKVTDVMRRTRYKSESTEWHNVRGRLLTASDMAAVFGENPFSTPTAVFMKKTRQSAPFKGNIATRWGQAHEAEAADVYEKLTGMRLVSEDIGLLVHDYEKKGDEGRKRYAATPDRLAYNGVLIEIKCPFRRKIEHTIPPYYMAQINFQLEVTGCDTLHFVQYKPPCLVEPGVFDIVQVERQKDWWPMHRQVMDDFWDRVIKFYQKKGLELGEIHVGTPQEKERVVGPLKMRVGEPMQIVL